MENNKQSTAVEWLFEELDVVDSSISYELFEKAKEMEKEQHQETFKQSRQAKIFEKDIPPVWKSFDEYHNKTFKSE